MLFGREHIKADKFGAFILSKASNLFPDPDESYESLPLLSDAIALIRLSLQRSNVNVTVQLIVPVRCNLNNSSEQKNFFRSILAFRTADVLTITQSKCGRFHQIRSQDWDVAEPKAFKTLELD